MKRRDFLKTGGVAGTAGLILDGCGKPQQLIPLLVSEDRFVPGEEGWVRTLCQQCSAGCGITVRVMQGESIRTIDGQQKRVKAVQAKKIEGNPEHPISMGGTCARGQAGVQALYHPDRIQTPLKLLGPRGTGQYQPITWKEAQQQLVTALQQQQASPQAIALLSGRRNRGTMGTVVERFAAGLGTTRRLVRSVRSRAHPQGDGTGDGRLAASSRRLRPRELSAVVQREPVRDVPLARALHALVRRVPPGTPGRARQVRPRGAAAVADGGVRRRVAADEARHRRPARARHGSRDRQREALRRRLRESEDERVRGMVGLARRLRARESGRRDRRARRVNPAHRARVRRAPAERRHRRQPRRRVADGDLRAECARGRIRPPGRRSVRGR